ncbi:MAG: carboxypeptidase regulatory-like domain-containing protein [Planctomycetes bacterium]|nr:carboxypeptidase regulatory-like domain-containing protein [Planctomycetota bacterium]
MRLLGCATGVAVDLLAVALLCSVGCGPANVPPLGLVTGTVTFNGKPLPNAEVLFNPSGGRMSFGATDSEGAYRLVYIETQQIYGALPGPHRVAIGVLSDNGPKLPARYSGPTSTLTAEVKRGSQVIDWKLDDTEGK